MKSPLWWAGMSTLVVGEIANFAAYTFAPPILVTPLGALSVIIGAILASFLLNEKLGHLGRVGCTLCLLGSLIIVLHAPEEEPVETVDEILHYAIQPGFLLYCFTVLVVTLVMIFLVAPRHGRTNPSVYLTVCSLVGSVSVMAIKGFGIAVKLTFSGNNQFTHPSTYVFAIVVPTCIVIQMNYFNKALDTFSTNVVNPIYYECTTHPQAPASPSLTGFLITFLGVHLLNYSRAPEPEHDHSTLEGGLMNPRLSLQGRMSMDGWADGPANATRSGGQHARRSSLYRSQNTTLFNAFDEHEQGGGGMGEALGLRRLDEDDEDDEDDDDDVALDYH
ncbi:magnesium transporter NIPA-domain-containing protein [Coprinopsis sp. MPI-PUGE-AT-0042]|nr:magnesium transporter NIPA-domain-containing protein [Coprinopsis sp. MPI-PUGE-AT-0042]